MRSCSASMSFVVVVVMKVDMDRAIDSVEDGEDVVTGAVGAIESDKDT